MSLIARKICPFCNSNKLNNIFSLSYKNKNLTEFLIKYYKNRIPLKKIQNYHYNLLKCSDCSGIFQEQIPDNNFAFKLYEKYISYKESLKKKENLNIKDLKKYFNEAQIIEKILKKKPKNISILEFGSGWGFWTNFMRSCNYKVKAFEISNKRISYMKKNNIKVIQNLKSCNEQFDFIYSDQTFEHIPNPRETLKILCGLLKKNGYILLGFPSSFLFSHKININYLPEKDSAHPLEHINLFNRKCLESMTKNIPLKIINFKTKYNFTIKQIISDFKNFFLFNSILLKKTK